MAKTTPAPAPVPHRGPKIACPDKLDGTHGTKAETFARQVAIYTSINSPMFPDEKTKLLFAASYLTGASAVWAAPYIDRITQGEEPQGEKLSFEEWTKDFGAMYFDSEKKGKAERALRALRQT